MNIYRGECSEKTFDDLIGLRWVGTVGCGITRQFYFADYSRGATDRASEYTIGVECAWRIEGPKSIIVGRDDYFEPAAGSDEPEWDSKEPRRDLQDQLIVDLLGGLKNGRIENSVAEFVVVSVQVDSLGGFRVEMSGNYALAVFPSSRSQMEWIYMRPGLDSFVYMNGRLSRTDKGGRGTQIAGAERR